MKNIDADLLRNEVKRFEKASHKSALGCADSETRKFHEGKDFAYQNVGILIDSLQQEQPEMDLEQEIDNVIADYSFVKTIDSGGFKTTVLDYAKIARHFYELGKNSK